MSAFAELAGQCSRRGWKLGLAGRYPRGRHEPGLTLDRLEIRDRDRELLAAVTFDPARIDAAAVDAAVALERKGLIA